MFLFVLNLENLFILTIFYISPIFEFCYALQKYIFRKVNNSSHKTSIFEEVDLVYNKPSLLNDMDCINTFFIKVCSELCIDSKEVVFLEINELSAYYFEELRKIEFMCKYKKNLNDVPFAYKNNLKKNDMAKFIYKLKFILYSFKNEDNTNAGRLVTNNKEGIQTQTKSWQNDPFKCNICKKGFKNTNTFETHKKSKKNTGQA